MEYISSEATSKDYFLPIQSPTVSLSLEERELGVWEGQAGRACRIGYHTGENCTEREVLKAAKGHVSIWVMISIYMWWNYPMSEKVQKWSKRTIPRAHTGLGTVSAPNGQNEKISQFTDTVSVMV